MCMRVCVSIKYQWASLQHVFFQTVPLKEYLVVHFAYQLASTTFTNASFCVKLQSILLGGRNLAYCNIPFAICHRPYVHVSSFLVIPIMQSDPVGCLFTCTLKLEYKLMKSDISLKGREPNDLTMPELKRWLSCCGGIVRGTKADLVKQ